MTSIAKPILIAVGVLAALGLAGAGMTAMQSRNTEEIMALKTALKKAQADLAAEHKAAQDEARKGEEWRGIAQAALDRVGRLEGRLKGVETKLAALGPQAPATAPETLPTEAPAIAKAMTEAGVKALPIIPPVAGMDIGLGAVDARKGLGLILDGKNYPEALERIGLLEEQVGTLKEQKAGLEDAVAAKTKEADANLNAYTHESEARASAEKMAQIQEGIAEQKDALLKKERAKKWIWGGSGLVVAVLVALL